MNSNLNLVKKAYDDINQMENYIGQQQRKKSNSGKLLFAHAQIKIGEAQQIVSLMGLDFRNKNS